MTGETVLVQNPASLPVHVKKNLGVDGRMSLTMFAVVLLMTGGPLLASRPSSIQMLASSTNAWVLLLMLVLVSAATVFGRATGQLDIDSGGVRVAFRRDRYLYAWRDIADVVPVSGGVRVELRGRTEAQNSLNVISKRFGIAPERLAAVLREGVSRWGESGVAEPSKAPGDSPADPSAKAIRLICLVVAGGMALIFAGIVVWQVSEYFKTVRLQKVGERAQAAVVRIYQDGCSRSGCSINVQYRFQFGGKPYDGFAYLTSDSNLDDPDYQYAEREHVVPIAFDPADPTRSDLNFSDWVFRKDPLKMLATMVGLIGGIMVVVTGGVLGLSVFAARRAQRRQAQPARAVL